MDITIHYKRVDAKDPVQQDLAPEEFFLADPGLEANWNRGVPVYDHAIDYLEEPVETIEWTRLVVDDQAANQRIEITETFWNSGRNRAIERADTGIDPYNEIVLVSQVPNEPSITAILRLVRQDGRLVPVYHGFLTLNADGSETEHVLDMPQVDAGDR